MSYNLIYKRIFIELPNKQYLPLIVSGCNNLTEGYGKYERRVRSWNICNYYLSTYKLFYTKEELLSEVKENIEKELQELTKDYENKKIWSLKDYVFSGLKIYGKPARYQDIINLYKNGIRDAVSLDTFLSYENSLKITIYNLETKSHESCLLNKPEINLNTLEEFNKKFIFSYTEGKNITVGISLNYSGEYNDSKLNLPLKEKKRRRKDYFYVVKFPNNHCLLKLTKRSVYQTNNYHMAKKFITQKATESYLKKHMNHPYLQKGEIIKINQEVFL